MPKSDDKIKEAGKIASESAQKAIDDGRIEFVSNDVYNQIRSKVAKEIFAELEDVIENREFNTGGIELAIDKSDYDLIKQKYVGES